MNKSKYLMVLLSLIPSLVMARNDIEMEKSLMGNKLIYEDKADISYLEEIVIKPKDGWIGRKVYQKGDVCFEVTKDLKIKKIKKPFDGLYRSANLPESIEIANPETKVKMINCDKYRSKEVTFN